MENGKWKMSGSTSSPNLATATAHPPSIYHLPFSICHPRRKPRAFTLIELLVTIGIIVTLIGLLLPAVFRAYRNSIRSRTQADLQLISTALEAYHADFSDYPRIDNDSSGTFNGLKDRGARLLCRAMIGPAPAMFNNGSAFPADGADGNGFRIRLGTGGKVYGPYVQTDKFNIGGTDKTNFSDATILDRDNNPILYYPGTPHAVITAGGAYKQFVFTQPPPSGAGYTTHPLYNAYDNLNYGNGVGPPTYLSEAELQWLLGDNGKGGGTANNGQLDAGEVPTTTGPYILWSAGADGIYGRDAKGKTDDITNFDFPGEIRK
jgi:prepilin-type N-terminal cleavage/methylation domain-containing protein